MSRIREIKLYGNTWIIKLNRSDIEDYGLVEGDKVDIDDLCLLKEKNLKLKTKKIKLKDI